MSKSAKGTVEAKGRNVKAKSGLNRSILDQGWFEFRRQLEYKQVWAGGQVLVCGVTVQQGRTVKHEPTEGIRKSSREPVGIYAL